MNRVYYVLHLMDGRTVELENEPVPHPHHPGHIRWTDPMTGQRHTTSPYHYSEWVEHRPDPDTNGQEVRTTEELLAEVFHYEGTTVATLDGETA